MEAEKDDPKAKRKTANEAKGVPLERLYRCQPDQPGCGLQKPANAFYADVKGLCVECVQKLCRRHATDIYWVPLVLHCYDLTRKLAMEAKTLATPEGRDKGWSFMVVDQGVTRGRDQFIARMIEGTKAAEKTHDHSWATELFEKYRGWFFSHYDIPAEKYSNLPKNGLLS